MGLAWAVFAPIAVIAAATKKHVDCGKNALPIDGGAVDNWFNVHRIFNSLAVTFTKTKAWVNKLVKRGLGQ